MIRYNGHEIKKKIEKITQLCFRDLRLPQVPEAPVDTHRPREATAVDSAETTIVPACPNFATGAHAILAHQDILGAVGRLAPRQCGGGIAGGA